MASIPIPFDRGVVDLELPDDRVAAVLRPRVPEVAGAAGEIVRAGLERPVSGPPLSKLARGKRRVTVVTSDHTRPLPSRITLPPLLEEIRRGNPGAEITILIGTGTHRPSTEEELHAKFGRDLAGAERLVCHRGNDPGELVEIGRLPSGAPLLLNRLAVETDLLVAEGFIEPHFFAGFSGGPKSILPGVAGNRTIQANHSGPNIGHPRARTGVLDGNPIHAEMEQAADLAGLAFIFNVVLAGGGRIAAAFAGSWRETHARGVAYVMDHARVPAVRSAVTVTSNGGYPLDQNLYQAVKGMTAAEAMTLPGGRIVMAAGCADGLGGEGFARLLAEMEDPAAFCRRAAKVPADETPPDLWEAQILGRVLSKCRVTLVTEQTFGGARLPPGLELSSSLDTAMEQALAEAGPAGKVTVIPDGVGVIPAAESG